MKILTFLFIVFGFLSTYGQHNDLIKKYNIDTNKNYSEFSDIRSFNGFENYGSGLIDDSGDLQFGLTIIHNDDKYVVIFENLADSKFKILDILEIDKQKGQYLQNMTCRISDDIDYEIIAMAKIEQNDFRTKEHFDDIIKAWRLNTKTKVIEMIDKSNVKCWNEGYGI